jgi:putative flippase GtrA
MNKLELLPRWLRFVFVGGIGFVVDAGMLAFLVHGQAWNPIPARLLSFSFALIVTWGLNRRVTFPGRGRENKLRNFQLYFAISLLGFWINFGLYVILLEMSSVVKQYPLLAVFPSAAVAAIFTYFGNIKVAFRT